MPKFFRDRKRGKSLRYISHLNYNVYRIILFGIWCSYCRVSFISVFSPKKWKMDEIFSQKLCPEQLQWGAHPLSKTANSFLFYPVNWTIKISNAQGYEFNLFGKTEIPYQMFHDQHNCKNSRPHNKRWPWELKTKTIVNVTFMPMKY